MRYVPKQFNSRQFHWIILYEPLIFQRRFFSTRKQKDHSTFFFHFNDPPFNLNSLTSRITKKGLLQPSSLASMENSIENIESLLIDVIRSCKELHLKTFSKESQGTGSRSSDTHDLRQILAQSKQFTKPLDLLTAVLDNNSANLTHNVLHQYLVLKPYPPSPHVISLLSQFGGPPSKRSCLKQRQLRDLTVTAVRRAMLNLEVDLAYEMIEASNQETNLFCSGALLHRYALLSSASIFTMSTGALVTFASIWEFPFAVVLGSAVAVGFVQFGLYLQAISKSTRVRWRRSALALPILTHQSDLFLVNQITVSFDEFIDFTVDNYHQIASSINSPSAAMKHGKESERMTQLQDFQRQQLTKHKMKLIETDQELMFNEYWTRAGEGFEWVEPDQDPADWILKRIRQNKIK